MVTKTVFLSLRRTLCYVYVHLLVNASLLLIDVASHFYGVAVAFPPPSLSLLIKFVYMNSHLINLCFATFSSISPLLYFH